MKSVSKELYGHSIKNPHIIHMLMHETEVIKYGPRKEIHDKIRYVCTGDKITPEKSTWDITKVKCKNCLHKLKTILHKKDWRGKRKAIYNGKLYDEVEDCSLPIFCYVCHYSGGSSLCYGLGYCPYSELMTKMYNGMHDCPVCGGEKELLKTIPTVISSVYSENSLLHLINNVPLFHFINLYKCKSCGHVW